MLVTVHRVRALAVLLMIDAAFVALHMFTRVLTWNGEPIVKRHEFLDMGAEISLPTWWQQSQLLVVAILCFALRGIAGLGSRSWAGLVGVFIFLSADEGAQFHESLTEPMKRLLDVSGGVLTFAWIVPGAAAVAIFCAAYFRFFLALPSTARSWTALAGACLVGGAIGGEILSGIYRTEYGTDRGYDAVVALEEGLEVLGASLFIFALLSLIQRWQGTEVALRVISQGGATQDAGASAPTVTGSGR